MKFVGKMIWILKRDSIADFFLIGKRTHERLWFSNIFQFIVAQYHMQEIYSPGEQKDKWIGNNCTEETQLCIRTVFILTQASGLNWGTFSLRGVGTTLLHFYENQLICFICKFNIWCYFIFERLLWLWGLDWVDIKKFFERLWAK